MPTQTPPHPTRPEAFVVTYFCQKASRRGQGIKALAFTVRSDAEEFAAGKQLYGKPAKVEVRS